ncbi:hypothetical protein TWF696_003196 [Orbilia brochopaga]|uniref:HNH nuclease domain-containing protein n=1 Tax=Orbilia brochopaga TaxID=3140254 RepID=A0AAV9U075_9PEZI
MSSLIPKITLRQAAATRNLIWKQRYTPRIATFTTQSSPNNSLKSIFTPSRQRLGKIYTTCLQRLDELPELTLERRLVVQAILTYTPNDELLRNFSGFSDAEVTDLWEVSSTALKNICSSWGTLQPSSTVATQITIPGKPRYAAVQRVEEVLPGKFAPVTPGSRVMRTLSVRNASPDSTTLVEKLRKPSFSAGAMERQSGYCAITNIRFYELNIPYETAHIFPHSALTNDESPATWRFLAIFLGERLRDVLAGEILECLQNCSNRITMTAGLHGMFDAGRFFLRPVSTAPGRPGHRYLDCEIVFWIPVEYMGLTRRPKRPEDQYVLKDDGSAIRYYLSEPRQMAHPEMIRISTPDPERLPLPSTVLLFWHEAIWRTIGAAGLSGTAISPVDASDQRFLYDEDEDDCYSCDSLDYSLHYDGDDVYDEQDDDRARL